MYGVYGYLDKLGCRWFTENVSRIPKTARIPLLAFNETGHPSFEYREPFFAEALAKDWAARNRQNGNRMHLDDTTGGKVEYFPSVHSFLQLVPPEKYFDQHPEYYSLIDGKRRAGVHSQLCLTNSASCSETSVAQCCRFGKFYRLSRLAPPNYGRLISRSRDPAAMGCNPGRRRWESSHSTKCSTSDFGRRKKVQRHRRACPCRLC